MRSCQGIHACTCTLCLHVQHVHCIYMYMYKYSWQTALIVLSEYPTHIIISQDICMVECAPIMCLNLCIVRDKDDLFLCVAKEMM